MNSVYWNRAVKSICYGKVCEKNSHPHVSNDNKIAVVHNGIIENFYALKKELIEKGFVFETDTDTEVIPNLIQYYYLLDHKILLYLNQNNHYY